MNRLFVIIVALFSLAAHHTSWGMLTVNDKIQMRPLKKYWTQEKIEKESREFLKSFGEHSINKMASSFCELSVGAQQHSVSRLSDTKLKLLWFGAKDLDVCFLTTLFNGNQKVAHIYREKPINKILEDYARAKEWFGVEDLDTQHLMMLKNSQIRLCKDWQKKQTICSADISEFMGVLKTLKEIDPGIRDIKEITDSTRLYPSLTERAHIFCTIPGNILFSICSDVVRTYEIGTPLGVLITSAIYGFSCDDLYALTIGQIKISPIIIALHTIGRSRHRYPIYKDHLKNNVLPNQPTLTDVLKKRPS